MIINNYKMNLLMIEQGKKKISNLKNFHGKMISQVLLKDFEQMFAPMDELQNAQDFWNQGGGAGNDANRLNAL